MSGDVEAREGNLPGENAVGVVVETALGSSYVLVGPADGRDSVGESGGGEEEEELAHGVGGGERGRVLRVEGSGVVDGLYDGVAWGAGESVPSVPLHLLIRGGRLDADTEGAEGPRPYDALVGDDRSTRVVEEVDPEALHSDGRPRRHKRSPVVDLAA